MPVLSRPIDAIFFLLSALGVVRAAPVTYSADIVPTSVHIPEGYHAWLISDTEKERLSNMLDIDFNSLGVDGTIVSVPKEKCTGCGKTSGFEDFVHGALKNEIHDKEFIVRSLKEKLPNNTPPHNLECAGCGTKFKRQAQWALPFNWTFALPVDETSKGPSDNKESRE